MDALPFYVGAGSQVTGLLFQSIIDMWLRKDFDKIVHDGSGNDYLLPPRLESEGLSRRWARDSDALLAALFSISVLATVLGDVSNRSEIGAFFYSVVAVFPLGVLILLLSVSPGRYWRATILKRSLKITPFVYLVTPLAAVTGLVVQLA